jgi:hypothetical protein
LCVESTDILCVESIRPASFCPLAAAFRPFLPCWTADRDVACGVPVPPGSTGFPSSPTARCVPSPPCPSSSSPPVSSLSSPSLSSLLGASLPLPRAAPFDRECDVCEYPWETLSSGRSGSPSYCGRVFWRGFAWRGSSAPASPRSISSSRVACEACTGLGLETGGGASATPCAFPRCLPFAPGRLPVTFLDPVWGSPAMSCAAPSGARFFFPITHAIVASLLLRSLPASALVSPRTPAPPHGEGPVAHGGPAREEDGIAGPPRDTPDDAALSLP